MEIKKKLEIKKNDWPIVHLHTLLLEELIGLKIHSILATNTVTRKK